MRPSAPPRSYERTEAADPRHLSLTDLAFSELLDQSGLLGVAPLLYGLALGEDRPVPTPVDLQYPQIKLLADLVFPGVSLGGSGSRRSFGLTLLRLRCLMFFGPAALSLFLCGPEVGSRDADQLGDGTNPARPLLPLSHRHG